MLALGQMLRHRADRQPNAAARLLHAPMPKPAEQQCELARHLHSIHIAPPVPSCLRTAWAITKPPQNGTMAMVHATRHAWPQASPVLAEQRGRLCKAANGNERTRPLAVRLCRSQVVCQLRDAGIERIKPRAQICSLLKVFCFDGVFLLLLQHPLLVCTTQDHCCYRESH